VVCLKQVLDPEAPASAYGVDEKTGGIIVRGALPVISPFDENALEAALRLKDTHPARLTVLSLGRSLSRPVLGKALAAGGDELVLLEDDAFDGLDSYATASVLAAAIRKVGGYDLVFTGRQAADTNAGAVGAGIAEMLHIPSVTAARKVELGDGRVRVERVLSDGYEIVALPLPALITVSSELGELRTIPLREVMAAQKKPVRTWRVGELGVDLSQLVRARRLSLAIPLQDSRCEVVPGAGEEEKGISLALRLREEGII